MQFARLIHSFRVSPATSFFILANVLVYVGLGLIDTRAFQDVAHDSFLIDWGANVPLLTFSDQFWRLLTNTFMHVNLTHIAMNMLALWSLGRILEPKIGSFYFTSIYIFSGLVGSLASAIWRDGLFFISCGASGAIMGIFGVAIVYALKNKQHSEIPLSSLGISLALTFGAGTIANIDNAAHTGGLVTGILMTLILIYAYRHKSLKQALLPIFFVLPIAVLLTGYSHYYDGKMAAQLKLAQLSIVLGNIGLGDNSSVYSGMPSVNECIESVMHETIKIPASAVNGQEGTIKKLKTCNTQGKGQKDFIATAAPKQFARCQALVGDLGKIYNKPEEQQFWVALNDYCQAHGDAYRTIYGKSQTFDANQYRNSTAKLSTIVQPITTEQVKINAAFVRIFSKINPLIKIVVNESGCPYSTCKRFKLN